MLLIDAVHHWLAGGHRQLSESRLEQCHVHLPGCRPSVGRCRLGVLLYIDNRHTDVSIPTADINLSNLNWAEEEGGELEQNLICLPTVLARILASRLSCMCECTWVSRLCVREWCTLYSSGWGLLMVVL